MLKVMTIVGTRPELIKLSRVIDELEKHTEHILVHSGQNYDYGLNEVFFNDLGIRKPDYFLDAVGDNLYETIGLIISKSGEIISQEKPDAVLFYGDTNTCLAVISAKREKIPTFHMEAGNRCFDQRVPEELNRKVLDHLSDINMPLTEHARNYLIREGIPADRVIKTGSPMYEVLNYYKDGINSSDVLERLGLIDKNYFVVSVHREENVDFDENLTSLLESLNAIAREFNKKIIVSTHPRTRKRIDEIGIDNMDSRINFMKPLGFFDYIKLQKHAYCVLSDSGTISEESSILNLPAITIRNAHERPEAMDEGILIMSGVKKDNIINSIKVVVDQFTENKPVSKVVADYDVPVVSKKVVRIILSYVDFVNRVVWRKSV